LKIVLKERKRPYRLEKENSEVGSIIKENGSLSRN